MATEPRQADSDPPKVVKSRSRTVKPGRLPVSEFAFDRAGAASPFGDEIEFPVPPEQLDYQHLRPEY